MLSEQSRGVIEFIDECRAQGMIKDELYLKQEEMWRAISDLEEVMRRSPEDRELYCKLETLIAETINLTKDIYFEYGENFESTQMNKLIAKVNKEAIIAYANMKGIKAKSYNSSVMGRKATKICKERDLTIGKVVDSKYGLINTYPEEVLDEIFM